VFLLLLSHCPFHLNGARVVNLCDAGDLEIAQAIQVHSVVLIEVGATHVPVEGNSVLIWGLWCLDNVEPVSNDVRMVCAPAEKLDLLDGNEAGQVGDFSPGVAAIAL